MTIKNLLFLFLTLLGYNSIGQTCTAGGDQVTYGNNSWIGYVYDHNGTGNPVTTPFATYKGYVAELETFDRNWGGGNPSCAVGSNNFAVRYRMRKTFQQGNYIFTIGADDGVRLSIDGGSSWAVSDWSDHGYQTVTYIVALNGTHDLVLEYYEKGGDARVSFDYGIASLGTTGTSSNTVCGVRFYDRGGPSGNYANSESNIVTFYPPNPTDKVQLTFTSFTTESSSGCNDWDILRIYNGNNNSAPLLNTSQTGCSSRPAPTTVTSTACDGSLTVWFKSDGSTNAAGWVANITCVPATIPTQVGFSATIIPPTAPSCTNWSNNWCAGSGTATPIALTNGINYSVEHVGGSSCSGTAMTNAFLQAWGTGSVCSGLSPVGSPGLNAISFNANYTGNHNINITSNNCTSGASANTCGGSFSHDFSGQSAVLRYRQNTTVNNTTPTASMCIGDTRTVTATLGGAHNNPTIAWSVVSGPGNLVGTTLSATSNGTIVLRATVGYCQSEINIPVTVNNSASITTASSTICHGNLVNIGGNITTAGAWTVNLSSGHTTSGTGGTWNISIMPTGTTTYSISSVTGPACPTTTSGSATITLPNISGAIASNNQSATCNINAGETVHFYNSPDGNYITSVTAIAGALGSTTARVFVDVSNQLAYENCNPTNMATAVMQRHWIITPTTNGQAQVRLPYTTTELTNLSTAASSSSNPDDGVSMQGDVLLSKYSGGAFPATTNVDTDPNNNCTVGGTTIHGNNGLGSNPVPTVATPYSDFLIPGFSEFWLHGSSVSSPLAVTLSDFSASCETNETKIVWTTASEQNSDYFILERSRDGYVWNEVVTVAGAGTTNANSHYSVADTKAGEVYYRLRQFDFNGANEIFGPILVKCESENELIVYPNPTSGNFIVGLNATEAIGESTVFVQDLNGKVISQRDVNVLSGTNTVHFEGDNLTRGTYIISVKGKDNKTFIPVRLIIQ